MKDYNLIRNKIREIKSLELEYNYEQAERIASKLLINTII